jgi:hypothetical protein
MIEKKSMIAYCGLNCAECAVFLATQKNDDDERKQVAEKWSKKFNWNLMPSDINCEGCKVDGFVKSQKRANFQISESIISIGYKIEIR